MNTLFCFLLRQACSIPSFTGAHLENLFSYYNQLYFIDRRFFPSSYNSSCITFEWYAAHFSVVAIYGIAYVEHSNNILFGA